MKTMYTFIISTMMFVSLLLILVVLLQGSKSDDTSSPLGNSGRAQLLGVSQTKNILEQTTWVLFIALIILAMGASFILKKRKSSDFESVNIEAASQRQKLNSHTTSKASDISENEGKS